MATKTLVKTLHISSPAFDSGESIPPKYTCDGEDISPALEIGELPEGTSTLALIVEDPDAPRGNWTHWLMWDIPPTNLIEENTSPGTEGTNDFGNTSYGGPCPPIGTHRYFFRVYALDIRTNLPHGSSREAFQVAMQNHIIGSGELMGLYSH
ncbi:MAG: YbhB/YbcL family Raf kinase inhibitor-like protein [Pontibacter sp.]|nr:YbhB/YbcL family Raf kinase inhibitor-like protein [Pontibacter sp.]